MAEYWEEHLSKLDEYWQPVLRSDIEGALKAGYTNIRIIESNIEPGPYDFVGDFQGKTIEVYYYINHLVEYFLDKYDGITFVQLQRELPSINEESLEDALHSCEPKVIKIHRVMDREQGYPWVEIYFRGGTPIQF